MNPPAPPPHSDELPLPPEVERRAVGRREADQRMHDDWLRAYEEKRRAKLRAVVWKLIVPAVSLLGGFFAAAGWGYVTPSARIIAVERAQAEIREAQEQLRIEQATTRRQLSSLLIIRCLDAQTPREILIAAGVNCTELMRETGLR